MHRSVYFASLAALLAGTAIAGPHAVAPGAPRPACCEDGAIGTDTRGASAGAAAPAEATAR